MDGQITFTEWMKDKNKQYAKNCRRCIGDYCYAKKENLRHDFMCPCEKYEEKLLCVGCKSFNQGLSRCLTGEICKRYCFSPAVSVKNLPDKWEEK